MLIFVAGAVFGEIGHPFENPFERLETRNGRFARLPAFFQLASIGHVVICRDHSDKCQTSDLSASVVFFRVAGAILVAYLLQTMLKSDEHRKLL